MMKDRPPPLPKELVNEFVMKAHGDFDAVKTMLADEPSLLNATWDWGNGDFENALGAAAHTGSREIALHLIEQGARVDLFAAAMLGQLAVVKAIIEANPAALHSKGAHSIPLMMHAQQGGEQAAEVLAYLQARLAEEK